ncbi:MAG: flagellar basal body-associated FliL family protein [Alphaproteobacteria bacterium]|nr:flagellar basal body-associated FliL family protein [Alphaproteobacteria bacterium]
MAEEEEEEAGAVEEGASSGGKSKKKLILIVLPLLVIIACGVGVFFSGMTENIVENKNKVDENLIAEGEEGAPKEGAYFVIPEVMVNLSNRGNQKPIYFKLNITLELGSQLDVAHAEKMLPRIVDSMQFYLREMRLEEIQGSMGTYRLKEEILGRLTKILAPAQVVDVLLKDIVVQ